MRGSATPTVVRSLRVLAARILQQIIGRATNRARFRAATLFSTALLAQSAFVFGINRTAQIRANGWSELRASANGEPEEL